MMRVGRWAVEWCWMRGEWRLDRIVWTGAGEIWCIGPLRIAIGPIGAYK